MSKNLVIILILVLIVALPFALRKNVEAGAWKSGDPALVIISPHTESIRYEFERAFSDWYQKKYGKPVKIDWRNIGGTTEITRYLKSEYANSAARWMKSDSGKEYAGAVSPDTIVGDKPPTKDNELNAYNAFRKVDDSNILETKIDLFFGGGEFDHRNANQAGMTVPAWAKPTDAPVGIFVDAQGRSLIPEKLSGETWRSDVLYGNAVSTFGIVYNIDRLADLGVAQKDYPKVWDDLANPIYSKQIGVADPTKSGSIAKAFEMIVHQKMHDRVVKDLHLTDVQIAANEKTIAAYIATKGKAYIRGEVPPELNDYQAALEAGWIDGIQLIQSIGANARYFTDSASKVPIDVSMGDAAVGMSIDFYGRYQAQTSRAADGADRMIFVTPIGGTSVSCDPISLLRGAPNRELAVRFIEFVLSEDGQRLWTYHTGVRDADGKLLGPEKYPLRRLPVRRDFYPSTQPDFQATHERHAKNASDDLSSAMIDPYQIAKQFTYYSRWTGSHFSIQRDLIRCMCLDSGEELRAAWLAINKSNNKAEALSILHAMPKIHINKMGTEEYVDVPLTWRTAPDMKAFDNLTYTRLWTAAFRENYRKALEKAGQ